MKILQRQPVPVQYIIIIIYEESSGYSANRVLCIPFAFGGYACVLSAQCVGLDWHFLKFSIEIFHLVFVDVIMFGVRFAISIRRKGTSTVYSWKLTINFFYSQSLHLI